MIFPLNLAGPYYWLPTSGTNENAWFLFEGPMNYTSYIIKTTYACLHYKPDANTVLDEWAQFFGHNENLCDSGIEKELLEEVGVRKR